MAHAKILLVDDENSVAVLASHILRGAGYTFCGCVPSGEEAIKVAREISPDLVLMDITLQGPMDGITTARRIRFELNIPVVYLTGQSNPEVLERAKVAEPFGYLLKPFSAEDLPVVIETALYQFAATRRRAKEVIQQAETRYLEIFENAVEGIYQSTSQGDLIAANPAFAAMLGYESPAELLLAVTDMKRQLHIDPTRWEDLQRILIEFGIAKGFELEVQRKDGSRIWISENSRAVLDANYKLICIEGFVQDITDRKRAEAELRESEERFHELFDYAPFGYHEYDGEGHLVRVNRTELEMLGYSPEEMLDRPVWEFAEEQEISRAAVKAKLAGRLAPMKSFERSYRRKDGTYMPVLVYDRILYDAQGRITGVRSTIQDIAEQKRVEKERALMEIQLRQALKLESVGQLAAGIAHEINTPTQYVSDNTSFLKDAFASMSKVIAGYERLLTSCKAGGAEPGLIAEIEQLSRTEDLEYLMSDIPKAIAQSQDGIKRIATIVRAMKEFSHPSGDEKEITDLNRAIESTLTVARNEWKYVADAVMDFDPSLPAVPCLPSEFNQAILNLVVNAAHAIGDVVGQGNNGKGTITVRTRKEPDWAVVQVSDSGTGIPEGIRRKIFDPFFTTKVVGRGTGQGLAITRSVIVDKHGGTIDFETEMGKGTTFTIRLPLNIP